jgi:uracil-DNA glycosylase
MLTPKWQEALTGLRLDFEKISARIERCEQINPDPTNIFRSLGNSPEDFRVIIVGQDPYPNRSHATGLAFSVKSSELKIPPTLRNIQKEFKSDIGTELANDLSHWSASGVMLLNRILTCNVNDSLSHKEFGWQKVTNGIVDAVVAANPNTVGILWGRFAQELSSTFNRNQLVISAHPSPLSAHRGFFGSRPFTTTNELLNLSNQIPIAWE